jgi:hypothetical protein
LARLPNVAVKASALPAYSSHDYPYYNLHPYLRRVFDAFGPRRMFWGTVLAGLDGVDGPAYGIFGAHRLGGDGAAGGLAQPYAPYEWA